MKKEQFTCRVSREVSQGTYDDSHAFRKIFTTSDDGETQHYFIVAHSDLDLDQFFQPGGDDPQLYLAHGIIPNRKTFRMSPINLR